MPPNEARLYFVVTVRGDLGPFSKQELREQLRERTFAATDRVRNAFGRPLGSVSEVLGNASQTMYPPQTAPAAASQRRPAKTGPPWPIIAVAGGIVVILLLLWLSSRVGSEPVLPTQPVQQTPPPAVPARAARPAETAPTGQPPAAPDQPAKPALASNGLPAGFTFIDLGDARPRGKADANDRGLIVMNGGGSDIWGNHDECAYLHRPLAGDGMITVELRTMDETDAWDKSGIMIRGSAAADAMHASIVAIHGGRVQFLSRYANGHETACSDLQMPSLPIWLRLERRGNTYAGSVSSDGTLWQQVGTAEISAFPGPAMAGLVACSHNRSVTNRTLFAGLSIVEAR